MSRPRLSARLRQNDEYLAAVKHIKALGLKHSVAYKNGRGGHPVLAFTDGSREGSITIATTPRYQKVSKVLKDLRIEIDRVWPEGLD